MTVQEFVDQYGKKVHAKKDGWLTCCLFPDHDDKTPSMSINHEGLFYCWGCHAKGNFAKLLHDIAGYSWKKAIDEADTINGSDFLAKPFKFEKDEEETLSTGLLGLYEVDWTQASVRYGKALLTKTELPAWTYLFRREMLPETLKHFQIGYDADLMRATIPVFYKVKGHSELAGFIGRSCTGDPIKYKNYPPLQTTNHIYNFDDWSYAEQNLLVVEGPMDVWYLYQMGIHAVALMTSRISETQVNKLLHTHSRFTLFFDNDKAGKDGNKQVAKALTEMGAQVDIVIYPDETSDMKELTSDQVQSMIDESIAYPIPYLLARI